MYHNCFHAGWSEIKGCFELKKKTMMLLQCCNIVSLDYIYCEINANITGDLKKKKKILKLSDCEIKDGYFST